MISTISVKPNKRSTGSATISVNPSRHNSRANVSGEEDRNSDNSQGEIYLRKGKTARHSSKGQKSKNT